MEPSIDDYGAHAPSWIVERMYGAMNRTYKWGYVGRRLFGRMRWLERLWYGQQRDVVDVERFGLRWRLQRYGNVTESCLLRRPDWLEAEEISFILGMAVGDFVFIDVGANCGLWCLRVANELGEGGTVIAVEPQPEVLNRLRYNARVNDIETIDVLDCVVGDRAGRAMLEIDKRNLGRSRISDTGSLIVEMRTLLDIVRSKKLSRVDAIKIDVEGYEDRVLEPFFRDAPYTLLPRVIVAEYSWSGSWKNDWLTTASRKGYRELRRTNDHNIILVREV